ncbi:hypothetical protein J7M23_07435 [Candidatus Sumerlaeota bacterium]|nr:hypothetical protein [Candidatus Sumerlaeota bacterium]
MKKRIRISFAVCVVIIIVIVSIPFASVQSSGVLSTERLNIVVRELRSEVESLRGLRFKSPITSQVATDEVIRNYLKEELDEEPVLKKEKEFNLVLQLFGYIHKELDLRKTYSQLLEEEVGGFYDEKKHCLFIAENFSVDDQVARTILVHEMCHALQDQYFNLNQLLEARKNNDDKLLALMAVIEGDATIVMNDYMQRTFSLKTISSWLKTFSYNHRAFLSTPYFIQQSLVFPYVQGLIFVNQAILCGGYSRRNALFRSPPESTEQIIHPEKYLIPSEFDAPTTITIPEFSSQLGEKWRLCLENNVGELMVRVLFEQNDMRKNAYKLAEGWDGDWYQLYTCRSLPQKADSQMRYLLIWRSVWDSDEDAQEFFRGFCRLQRKLHPDARIHQEKNLLTFSTGLMIAKIKVDDLWVDFFITNAEPIIIQRVEGLIRKSLLHKNKN